MPKHSSTACCSLFPTPPVEDTLRAILVLAGPGTHVRTSLLAQYLSTSTVAVTLVVARLGARGLVELTDDGHPALTRHGAAHARHVVRRYRLIRAFLMKVVGLTWAEAHAEADRVEHVVSDRLLERIDTLLERPDRDPGGDPIPRPDDGEVVGWGIRLDGIGAGAQFRVERVDDGADDTLRQLADLEIRPGTTLEVVERGRGEGPFRVRLHGREHVVGMPLARLVHGRELPRDRAEARATAVPVT
jgi:DtxR family transcriptional regulator, Mn-dependent transcriptional regulator